MAALLIKDVFVFPNIAVTAITEEPDKKWKIALGSINFSFVVPDKPDIEVGAQALLTIQIPEKEKEA